MYARYIPSAQGPTTEVPAPVSPPSPIPAPKPTTTPIEEEPAEPAPKKEKRKKSEGERQDKKKKKKRKIEDTADDSHDAQEDGANEKFAKILAKRERYIKLAETFQDVKPQEPQDDPPSEIAPELHDVGPMPQPPRSAPRLSEPTYSTLPDWLAKPVVIHPQLRTTFDRLGIDRDVCKILASQGMEEAFPIQVAAIKFLPPMSEQFMGPLPICRDLLLSAGTGSGKTLAYCLPMFRDLCGPNAVRLRGVVILPTRELVEQVRKVMTSCARAFERKGFRRLRIGTAVGHQNSEKEHLSLVGCNEYPPLYKDPPEGDEESLGKMGSKSNRLADERFGHTRHGFRGEKSYYSKVDIVICTPARLFHHIKYSKGFSVDDCRWIVLDEADNLLIGHEEFNRESMPLLLPKSADEKPYLRKVIVGATLTRNLNRLALLQLRDPRMVVLESDGKHIQLPASLQEFYIKVNRDDAKPLYYLDLLNKIDCEAGGESRGNDSDVEMTGNADTKIDDTLLPTILVFARDRENVANLHFLASVLRPELASQTACISARIGTQDRKRIISGLKTRKLRIVIASDIASRGLDVEGLDNVINYDIPNSVASYVHRVGRTARAGKRGSAWSLVAGHEMPWFKREILGQDDSRQGRKKVANGLGIHRSGEVERILIPWKISEERQQQYEEALLKLKAAAVEGVQDDKRPDISSLPDQA